MSSFSPMIAAVATAPGRGGVGIVRVSGSSVLPLAAALSGGKRLQPRVALYTDFLDGGGAVIDSGLMLYFAAPASFTGEEVLELHGHGGTVVMQMLLARCVELGARLAEAGEFSKRAFLNGKMDLAQAEGVADLIDASSRAAAKMAVRSLKGVFSKEVRALADGLIDLRMLVEAALDFPEEEIDFLEAADAQGRLAALQAHAERIMAQAEQGARLREGMAVVLVGAPNVGKSSLLNALAGDEVAIVTEIAGTTRDTVREQIMLDGIPVHVTDTAGLRETDDVVEKIGIGRSRQAAEEADVALVLRTAADEVLNPTAAALLDALPEGLCRIDVVNKIDLGDEVPRREHLAVPSDSGARERVYLSAKTGAGLAGLRDALLAQIGWRGESDSLFLARRRHLDALARVRAELAGAAACAGCWELFAEHLRLAQAACNEITGEFGADDLLGVIFSRFCIGK